MANDVAAGFPQVDLTPNTTITVTLDQAGAKITGLAVHGYQDDSTKETGKLEDYLPAFTYGLEV